MKKTLEYTGLLMLWLLMAIPVWPYASPGKVRVTDALGRSVSIQTPVRRIVVLPSDALEIIRILDAESCVVGVNDSVKDFGEYWPELNKRTSVGHPFIPNYERIVSLSPDLVLAYGWRPGPELEDTLTPLGIQVLRMDFYRMSTLAGEVRDLGRILGKPNQACAYETWYLHWLSFLEKSLKRCGKKPRVYMEGYGEFAALGPTSGGYEMGTRAGGDVVSASFPIQNPSASNEFIMSQDPDMIVKMVSGRGQYSAAVPHLLNEAKNRMISRPGWRSLSAVRQGRLLALSADIGPGPRGIIGVLHMAKMFYPDEFMDLDVGKAHREYMEMFQGVPYQGVYVCTLNAGGPASLNP